MQHRVKVIVMSSHRAPKPGPSFVVQGATIEALKRATRYLLLVQGLKLHAITFTPTGILAYAEPIS